MSKSPLHRKTRPLILISLIGFLGFVAPVPTTSAQFKAWVMAKLPDTPEGLGLDSKGNIYTTLLHTGEVVMLKDNSTYEHIAWVPTKEESGKGILVGLDVDKADNIYVAYHAHSKYDNEDDTNPFHPRAGTRRSLALDSTK